MIQPVQTLVNDVRIMSGLRNNQLFSDLDIVGLLNDACQELYDTFVTANQLYNVQTLDFTLTNGTNTVDLPSDFLNGQSVSRDPDTSRPRPLPYLSNWLERDRLQEPHYAFTGSEIMVVPQWNCAGTYRLWYTPHCEQLGLGGDRTVTVDPADLLGTGVDDRTTLALANANFTSDDEGSAVVLNFSSPNSQFNGPYKIYAVLSTTLVSLEDGPSPIAFDNPAAGTVLVTPNYLPRYMEPWSVYVKLVASISIRQSREKDASDLERKLQAQQARVATVTANRQTEPTQPPLSRGSSEASYWFGDD